MGRKLGNLLIIYGILNFFASFFFGSVLIVVAAFLWMLLMIGLGSWQRGKAKNNERLARLEEQRQRQHEVNVNLSNQIANQPQSSDKITYDALANTINKILDEREGKGEVENGIRYKKEKDFWQ